MQALLTSLVVMALMWWRNGDWMKTRAVSSLSKPLDDASRFIDSFLAGRVTGAVADSSLLTRLCVDIAVYWLAIDAGLETDEKRRRFEDAKDWLQRFSRGEIGLSGGTAPDQGGGEGASFSSQSRVMSRDTLAEF